MKCVRKLQHFLSAPWERVELQEIYFQMKMICHQEGSSKRFCCEEWCSAIFIGAGPREKKVNEVIIS
jgi:hypothetical protein